MFANITEQFIDTIFPPLCIHCRREGAWLCPSARHGLESLHPLVDPLPLDGIDRVFCLGTYDDPLISSLVTGLKYGGYTAYREVVGQIIAPLTTLLAPVPCIPVPLHPSRQRSRGFNQSMLIAQALAKNLGLSVMDCIHRTKATHTQTTLTEAARRRNVEHAFRLRSQVETVPERGILVDDVITTGSTIQACASVLRKTGMKQITAVALAKG